MWNEGDLVILSKEEAGDIQRFADQDAPELSERFGLPPEVEPHVLRLVAEIIEEAATYGSNRWGLTDYKPYMRVNVGWTEIITTYSDFLRLIVDGELAFDADPADRIDLFEGEDERGYYPSIKGSLLAELSYEPIEEFLHAVEALRPAWKEAVRVSAKRPATPAIRKGHSKKRLSELGEAVGRELPRPKEDKS